MKLQKNGDLQDCKNYKRQQTAKSEITKPASVNALTKQATIHGMGQKEGIWQSQEGYGVKVSMALWDTRKFNFSDKKYL